jgi:RNA-directed DNA polymerase
VGRLYLPTLDMDFGIYSYKFYQEAKKAGYSAHLIKKCISYAKILFDNNVPVIYNSDHLSVLVGYSKNYLKRAVAYPPAFYREFPIPKKNGRLRYISEPLPSLKHIQRWILENILYKIEIHPYAKAYSPGRTIKDNLKYHKRKNLIITFDITDFFDSISADRIESIFRKLGYSQIVSNLLCKLVTKNGVLAQGAPTSPYLSNIVMFEFDSALKKYSLENKLMCTRYADDITLSGDEIDIESAKQFVEHHLSIIGLSLNLEKIKIMSKHKRQVVTGVVVNEKIQVKRKDRKLIRQEIYYIQKFGLADHISKRKIDKKNYLGHLLGKINYSLFINPNDKELASYKAFLASLVNPI